MHSRASNGEEVGPLCGLAFAVKDNIDVVGYETVAGTPALEGPCPFHQGSGLTACKFLVVTQLSLAFDLSPHTSLQ